MVSCGYSMYYTILVQLLVCTVHTVHSVPVPVAEVQENHLL
jgi:hypothetical protein